MYRYPVQVQLFQGWDADARHLFPRIETYQFVVRTVTRREFQNWQLAHPVPTDFEDRLLREAVLETPAEFRGRPWDWDTVLAGIAAQVVEQVLSLSGFSQEPHPFIMERVREYTASEEAKFDMLILTATDAYKLEELQDMHPEDYHKLVALAQWKLGLIGLDPDIILDPEAYEKKMKAARQRAMMEQQMAQMQTPGMRRTRGNVQVVSDGEMAIQAGGQVEVPKQFLQGR